MHYNVIIQKKIRKTRRFCAADKYDANGFPGNGGSEKSEVNGMATYYDDTEYERRGGGFWGKFLAVFLGFLFGIICTLGGLAGLGYVLYAKIKIAEGFKAVNKITGSDIDYTEYITEEYAQKTIAELMKDLGALSSDFQNQTASLSSLEKFSPKVRETAESIVKKISEYGVAVDTDVLMTTPLSGMSEFLTDTLNTVEVGKVLDKSGILVESNDSYEILMLLCYGEKGVDYAVDGEGRPVKDDKGNVTMLGSAAPTTVGDLTKDTNKVLDKMTLSAVMNATNSLDNSDPMIRALLYGAEGESYTYDEEKKEVTMLPLRYKYDEENNSITDADGKTYAYDETGKKWLAEDGGYILSLSAQPTVKAAAADEETVSYTYAVYTKEGTLVCSLAAAETPDTYHAFDKQNNLLKHQPLSVGDLMGGDLTGILNDIRLGDALKVTAASDAILIALAYGSEGVDYEIDASTNAIVRLEGGKAPTTVKDLRNDETASGLLKGLKLGDVLGISPLDQFDDAKKDPDPMMLALAYGEEGTDYVIEEKDGEKVIVWLGDSGPRTIGDLTAGDSAIFDTITLASVMNLTPASDPIMISLAFGKDTHYTIVEEEFVMLPQKYTLKEGVLYDDNGEAVTAEATGVEGVYKVTFVKGTGETQKTEIYYAKADSAGDAEYYLYTDETCAGEKVLYKKTSIGDLKGDNASDIIKDIQLATVLDLTPSSDSILIALAYGNEGEDFEYVLDGEGNKTGFRMLGDAKPRTIKQLKDSNLVNEIRLSAILQTKPEDKITMYLLYGVEGTHYKMENGEVVMLGDYPPRTIGDLSGDNSPVSTITKDLTIGDLVGTAGDSKLLAKISDWKIAQLSDQSQINTIKLGEVIDIKDTDPALLKNLAETSIGELNTRINTMTLAEILGEEQVNGSTFLKHLDTSTINSLAADLDKLTIQQVFEDKIYKKDADGNYVLGEDGSKVLTGTWKYLLVKDGKEQECQIKEIDSLVSNMTANMQSATLNDLSDDKILTLDEAFRRKNIKYDFGPLEKIEPYFNAQGQEKTTIGELTITELVDYVGKLLDKVGA